MTVKRTNSEQKSRLTAIDLFAGCGGMTFGLRRAGFDVLGALEIDRAAADTYRLNHTATQLKEADIRQVDARAWMHELHIKPGALDLLAGCPPCQGFSRLRTLNGSKSNRDPQNRLIMEMARMIDAFRPTAVMVENVPGLECTAVFNTFVGFLRRQGYQPTWKVLDASEYGVPQRRKRLVLLAGNDFEIPFGKKSRATPTVRQVIAGLKRAGSSGDPLHDMPEHRTQKMKKWIESIPKNGGSRSDLPREVQRECHTKSTGFKDVYGRMSWDKVAPTITGGCFNPSKGRFLHPEENRNITMREAALLQTFPKSFRLPPQISKTAAALMIGNALPPEFVRRQGLAIRSAIGARTQEGSRH